eukprot:4749975-Amphidinium_carterae.1
MVETKDALGRIESFGHNYALHGAVMMRTALLQRSLGETTETFKHLTKGKNRGSRKMLSKTHTTYPISFACVPGEDAPKESIGYVEI